MNKIKIKRKTKEKSNGNKLVITDYKEQDQVPYVTSEEKIYAPRKNTDKTYSKNPKINEKKSDDKIIDSNTSNKCCKQKCIIISIVIGIIIAIAVVVALIFLTKKENKEGSDKNEEIVNSSEIKKIFEPSFKINSEVNSFNQLLMKSNQKYTSLTNGVDSSYTVFTKTKYDLYTLNESKPAENEDYYSTKYTTILTINSQCTDLSFNSNEEEPDCQLENYLDLSINNKNNLRRDDEDNENLEEKLKKVFIPLCIIEHTDTNIIISLTCPETLASNVKDDIKSAFQMMRPNSIKGLVNDEIIGNNIEIKENKKYIKIFNKVCDESIFNSNKNKNLTCEEEGNIITDSNGNVLSSKFKNIFESLKDENNKYSKILNYSYELLNKKNPEDFDSINYKENYQNYYEIIKTIMKKEDHFTFEAYKDFVQQLSKEKEDSDSKQMRRELVEQAIEQQNYLGITEKEIFSKTLDNFEFNLTLKNDIGLEYEDEAKAISNYIITDVSQKSISNNLINAKLNETINKFVTLTKLGNKLATSLYIQVSQAILNLTDIINSNITDLNKFLASSDLSSIFDSSLAIDKITFLPYKFVPACQNLYDKLTKINDDIAYTTHDIKNELKDYISSFLTDSHNHLNNLFNKLKEVTNSLSSTKSRIAEISSYYLNNTDTSYYDIIKKAVEILDNYYIKEKNLIEPIINNILNEFSEDSLESITNEQSNLNKISDRLDIGTLSINLANAEDIKRVITNIYNSYLEVKQIISNVEQKLLSATQTQSNGYFETEKNIQDKRQLYGQIADDAIKIAKTLDNNELIDTTFDNIMINFRDQFTVLLKYIEKSKKLKFPIKENILADSVLSPSSTNNNIDELLKKEKLNILNFIRDENKQYLKDVEEQIKNFKEKYDDALENYINDIEVQLSDKNLNNLDYEFSQSIKNTNNKISKIIENNRIKAEQYMNNVLNAKSSHITQAYKNKFNAYINDINAKRNYISADLRNFFMNKYKNVINQLRKFLQSIKSNSIIKKYANYFPSYEKHIRTIELLFERLEKHISDKIFNKNHLSQINNIINENINRLNNVENKLRKLYAPMSKKEYKSNLSFDFYKTEVHSYKYCDEYFFGKCIEHNTEFYKKYIGYYVTGSNNHKTLESINFQQYVNNFDASFNNIYSKFSNSINSYNNIFNELENKLKKIKQDISQGKVNYLDSINSEVKNFLKNNLSDNIVIKSYEYYKNELDEKMLSNLNEILKKWEEDFDKIIEDIDSNLDNFKAPILEFGDLGSIYYTLYSQGIASDYASSVVEQRKNDFNYTIKYYYNLYYSKVNKTFSYIMNNIPSNNEPFNEILNQRANEINTSYYNLINEIQNSKNNVLQKDKQIQTLNIKNENDFFEINTYILHNNEEIDNSLISRINRLYELAYKLTIKDSDEAILARFYLENAQSGKQIKNIYEPINDGLFIDLQEENYQNLIGSIMEIDQDEFINNLNIAIKESNEYINQYFKYEKEKYLNIIEENIYNEFYSKDSLDELINSFYIDGLNILDKSSENIISGYINEILNKIKEEITNEVNRLTNTLTSYSNNFTKIQQTLNNYKTSIFEKFNSSLTSVIDEFHQQIFEKFYSDYILNSVEEYLQYSLKAKFGQFSFVNVTFNLTDIMHENIKILTNEYKNLVKNKVELHYKLNFEKLDSLFSFSGIKNTITNSIDLYYNSMLLPILEKKVDDGVYPDYDLPDNSISIINFLIEDKINKTKELIEKMKGEKYNINNNWNKPNYDSVKATFNQIKNLFNSFIQIYGSKELETFNEIIFDNINNNYKIILDNFISYFSKDYFDRILKYNEIQKIKSLYNNIKYSLVETLFYYIKLCYAYDGTVLIPQQLKIKLLTLNNIFSTINLKEEQVISSLDEKLDELIEKTKEYMVKNYISKMKTSSLFKLAFNDKILTIIENKLDSTEEIINKEFVNEMNTHIKKSFIEQYTKTLKKESENMKEYIQRTSEQARDILDQIEIMEPDDILNDIDNKLNQTLKAIDDYNTHFKSFKIPEGIISYLKKYVGADILPNYNDINDIIEVYTKNYVIDNLDENSEKFLNSYSIDNYEKKSNEIKGNLTDYINNFNNIVNKYSLDFSEKIKKPSEALENLNDNQEMQNQNIQDLNYVEVFDRLKNSSIIINESIENSNLFESFEKKIDKLIHNLNTQYDKAKKNIKGDDNEFILNEKLNELYDLGSEYYERARTSYEEIKELILNAIIQLDESIDKGTNNTYEKISNEYLKVNESFIHINNKIYKQTEFKPESVIINKNILDTEIMLTEDNEFLFEIIYEEGKLYRPKVNGKVINRNIPKNLEISNTKNIGLMKQEEEITIDIKNAFLITEINYDGLSNSANLSTYFSVEDYNIKTETYLIQSGYNPINLGGFNMTGSGNITKYLTKTNNEPYKSQYDKKFEIINY